MAGFGCWGSLRVAYLQKEGRSQSCLLGLQLEFVLGGLRRLVQKRPASVTGKKHKQRRVWAIRGKTSELRGSNSYHSMKSMDEIYYKFNVRAT